MAKVRTRFKEGPPRHCIRAWRKYRGFTLEELAEKIGVTHGALSQLERGQVNYTQPMLESLAEHLSCTPADLINRDPSEALWPAIESIRLLSPADQGKIVAMIKAFQDAA